MFSQCCRIQPVNISNSHGLITYEPETSKSELPLSSRKRFVTRSVKNKQNKMVFHLSLLNRRRNCSFVSFQEFTYIHVVHLSLLNRRRNCSFVSFQEFTNIHVPMQNRMPVKYVHTICNKFGHKINTDILNIKQVYRTLRPTTFCPFTSNMLCSMSKPFLWKRTIRKGYVINLHYCY